MDYSRLIDEELLERFDEQLLTGCIMRCVSSLGRYLGPEPEIEMVDELYRRGLLDADGQVVRRRHS